MKQNRREPNQPWNESFREAQTRSKINTSAMPRKIGDAGIQSFEMRR
jgi:hypothetical protein